MSKISDLKQALIRYIHSQQTGWIYALRVFHGKFHEWLFGRKVYWLSINRRKEKKVVATAFDGKVYGDNPQYIVEKINELLPDAEIVWISSVLTCGNVPSYIHTISFENQKTVIKELSSASIILDNNCSFNSLARRHDQLHIETWHGGLGLKKIGTDANRKYELRLSRSNCAYDFYISDSDHLTKIYRTAFGYTGPVWKCGYPIEDALLTENGERLLYREWYHIPQDTNVVLYAPTFRSQYRWKSKMNAAHVVDSLQKRFGGKWVMMVHWHQNMRQEDRIMPDVIDATDCDDMQSLVKVADAFISDYSSSIFQAVQCNIPCFVYADDYEEYNMDRGLYYPLDEQPFPYALTEEALIDNILHYDAALWKEKWQQYRIRTGHIVTGHSAEDVAKVCVDFLNGKSKTDIMKEIPFETRF